MAQEWTKIATVMAGFCLAACGVRPTQLKLSADAPLPAADRQEIAVLTGPPTWTRLDAHTLQFTGEFQPGDRSSAIDGLNAILRDGDDTVVVNSGGGDVKTGVALGQRLAPLHMTIVVDGVCASSCANYIFTAGAHKQIKRGWVGYHGNATAMFGVGWEETKRDIQEQQAQEHKPPYKDEDLEAMRREAAPGLQEEQRYLAAVGVQQALFDRTQRDDKGMGDGKTYAFFCPTPATFVRYGIHNVVGEQDMHFLSTTIHNVTD